MRENGPKHKLWVYAKNVRNTSLDEIIVDGVAYLVRRVNCWVTGVDKEVVILISKRKKDGSRCFILSTDTSLSNEEIIGITATAGILKQDTSIAKIVLG